MESYIKVRLYDLILNKRSNYLQVYTNLLIINLKDLSHERLLIKFLGRSIVNLKQIYGDFT
jgi:hypothetical protein